MFVPIGKYQRPIKIDTYINKKYSESKKKKYVAYTCYSTRSEGCLVPSAIFFLRVCVKI